MEFADIWEIKQTIRQSSKDKCDWCNTSAKSYIQINGEQVCDDCVSILENEEKIKQRQKEEPRVRRNKFLPKSLDKTDPSKY